MADDAQSAADSSAYQQVGTRNPVGCATFSKPIENATGLPSAGVDRRGKGTPLAV